MILLDEAFDLFFNVLAHRIGVRVLKALSGGRFQGERGFAWGWALVVGGMVLIAPLVGFVTWLISADRHDRNRSLPLRQIRRDGNGHLLALKKKEADPASRSKAPGTGCYFLENPMT